MAGIIISEASAQNDMLYGKWQAPIKSFLEKRAEAIDQGSVAAKIFKKVNSSHWAPLYAIQLYFRFPLTIRCALGYIQVGSLRSPNQAHTKSNQTKKANKAPTKGEACR